MSACDFCFADPDHLGEIANMYVIRHNGNVTLVDSNGHNALVRFTTDPWPDPVPVDDDAAATAFEADPTLSERADRWLDEARDAMLSLSTGLDLRASWWFVRDLVDAGYDPDEDGDAELWLYDRIGRIVAAVPAR